MMILQTAILVLLGAATVAFVMNELDRWDRNG